MELLYRQGPCLPDHFNGGENTVSCVVWNSMTEKEFIQGVVNDWECDDTLPDVDQFDLEEHASHIWNMVKGAIADLDDHNDDYESPRIYMKLLPSIS